jgi:hypothetical protein
VRATWKVISKRFKVPTELEARYHSLNLVKIENDNTITLCDGCIYGLGNIEGVNIYYAPNAQYILNGESIALPSAMESRTFMGKVGGETIMITKGKLGKILTMDIFGLDGSTMSTWLLSSPVYLQPSCQRTLTKRNRGNSQLMAWYLQMAKELESCMKECW